MTFGRVDHGLDDVLIVVDSFAIVLIQGPKAYALLADFPWKRLQLNLWEVGTYPTTRCQNFDGLHCEMIWKEHSSA
jgi:hypothetical protein